MMPPPNNKFLLKMSSKETKNMSPHECNRKISVFFHAEKKEQDEQKKDRVMFRIIKW